MSARRSKRPKASKRAVPSRKSAAKSARRHQTAKPVRSSIPSRKRIGKLFEDLVAVQSRLRAPGGCPWDREQTHATLRTFLIEEAYEVIDAIEAGNPQELSEELGDLLLQVLFHADLAKEARAFDISNVIAGIHDKMVRRHPHVFGDVKAETSGEVLKNWAQLKAKEKQLAAAEGKGSPAKPPSLLDGVPRHAPALLEGCQLTRRAAQVGFDWENVEGIFDKLQEEIVELQAALSGSNQGEIEDEVGDLLFSLVNLARFLRLDPEVMLKKSNRKFKVRFQEMEKSAANSGTQLSQLSKEALEDLWAAAKVKVAPHLATGSGS